MQTQIVKPPKPQELPVLAALLVIGEADRTPPSVDGDAYLAAAGWLDRHTAEQIRAGLEDRNLEGGAPGPPLLG